MVGLDVGESVSRNLDLYATLGGDGCLPGGDFRFETNYRVATGENAVSIGEREDAAWGFSLGVE